MGKIIDITGQTFGFLKAIEPQRCSNGRFGWKCQCICGKEITVDSGNLRSGKVQSCGCQKNKIIGQKLKKDLTGQKFNNLMVLGPTEERCCGSIVWRCKCSCGNETFVPTSNLKNNHTTSCGCKKYSIVAEKIKLKLLNQRFGKLLVVEEMPTENHESQWKCLCDCGDYIIVTGWHLTKGLVSSCGCIYSKGEHKIRHLLSENNIFFEEQKTFSTCLSEKGKPLRFDFFVNNKYLIEYDGEQHYLEKSKGFYTEEKIEKIKKYDEIKNQWCKENNIPLIRIKYTQFNNLNINDLILEEK